MTNEEAIELIVNATYSDEWQGNEDLTTAHNMAIKALEQEPFKSMVEIDLDSVIKQKYIEREVLDKIRAEIAEYGSIWVQYTIKGRTDKDIGDIVEDAIKQAKAQVLYIIDKYRAESEDV